MNKLENLFTYHVPTTRQQSALRDIRKAGLALAIVIEENTPNCADRAAAIRKVREAVMTANAAVVVKAPAEGA